MRFSRRDCGERYLHGRSVSLQEPCSAWKSAFIFRSDEGSSAQPVGRSGIVFMSAGPGYLKDIVRNVPRGCGEMVVVGEVRNRSLESESTHYGILPVLAKHVQKDRRVRALKKTLSRMPHLPLSK